MLEKLKLLYEDHIISDATAADETDYFWYIDEKHEKIGIDKTYISHKEKELLDVFLTPLPERTVLSKEQQMWKAFLFENGTVPTGHMVRFLHIELKEAIFEKQALEEALQGLLAPCIVVWGNYTNVVVIETLPETTEDVHIDIFQTLTSDFFMTPSILIGKIRPLTTSLASSFRWEQACFSQGNPYMTQPVFSLEDVLPAISLTAPHLLQPLLQHVDDKDLLRTIRTYLEANMNISLTAKRQYMHRNSVQYRVDKFIEKTGIDIKTFKGAVSVYLALLQQENMGR